MHIELAIVEPIRTEASEKTNKLEMIISAKQLTRQGEVEIAASTPNTYKNHEQMPDGDKMIKIMLDNYLSNKGWIAVDNGLGIYRTVEEETENTNLEFCRIDLEFKTIRPDGWFRQGISEYWFSANRLTKDGWEYDFRISEPWSSEDKADTEIGDQRKELLTTNLIESGWTKIDRRWLYRETQ